MAKVLIVKPEPSSTGSQAGPLATDHQVLTAAGRAAALACASRFLPDVIVLDVGIGDDPDILADLRRWNTAPVIVVGGRTEPSARIHALEAGARDYITTPCSPHALLVGIRSAQRRDSHRPQTTTYRFGPRTVDLADHTVHQEAGPDIHLTPGQWSLLAILLPHSDCVVSSALLLTRLRRLRPGHAVDLGQLRFLVAGLRRALEADPADPRHLLAEPGSGYRYRP